MNPAANSGTPATNSGTPATNSGTPATNSGTPATAPGTAPSRPGAGADRTSRRHLGLGLNPSLTLATARRVLAQVRADHRTLAMLLVVPCVLMGLLAWIFAETPVFDRIGAPLLGVFPFIVMFLVTSVATLRERSSGTLERLLSTPLGKGDFLGGYALAFGALAMLQALVATALSILAFGLDVAGPVWLLVLVAVVDAVLGTTVGLLVSAFARTEFQAVQFMPAFVLPQFLLCGLLVARDNLPDVLRWVSDVMPLSYAVDAMRTLSTRADATGEVLADVAIVAGFALAAIVLGSLTLRRRTP